MLSSYASIGHAGSSVSIGFVSSLGVSSSVVGCPFVSLEAGFSGPVS